MNGPIENTDNINGEVNFKKYSHTARLCNSDERKLQKAFLISFLHKLFRKIFYKKLKSDVGRNINYTMESYAMDGKIIQVLISEIIETGDYTLEGIASYTRVPLDVIVDASFCNCKQLSITLWIKIVDLYMQVKPAISQLFFEKLAEIKKKHHFGLSLLLNEN